MNAGQARHNVIERSISEVGSEPSIGIATIALGLVTAVAVLHPDPLVLPVLSILLVVASLLTAAFTSLRHRASSGPILERLHLAGLILFFGFAASMLADLDLALGALEARL